MQEVIVTAFCPTEKNLCKKLHFFHVSFLFHLHFNFFFIHSHINLTTLQQYSAKTLKGRKSAFEIDHCEPRLDSMRSTIALSKKRKKLRIINYSPRRRRRKCIERCTGKFTANVSNFLYAFRIDCCRICLKFMLWNLVAEFIIMFGGYWKWFYCGWFMWLRVRWRGNCGGCGNCGVLG